MTQISMDSVDLPEGWRKLAFAEGVREIPRTKPSVPRTRYQPVGRYPVVDQGTGLVAGFTDVEEAVYSEGLPVIVFGDHTRALKYVDFPFATGADGTKLLRAESGLDPRFLYFALLNTEVPSHGYNRHFRWLKEAELSAPVDVGEQREIAHVLSKLREAAEIESVRSATLQELKAATTARLFGQGPEGIGTELSEFGEIPVGWMPKRVEELGEIVTGSTPPTAEPLLFGGDIPFISPADLGDLRWVRHAGKTLSKAGALRGRQLPKETVLVVCIGSTIGKVGMTEEEISATNQQINAIRCGSDYDPCFVHYLMRWNADSVRSHSSPSPVPILTKGAFSKIRVAVPRTIEEQRTIGRVLASIDDRLESACMRETAMDTLFRSALQLLMTGAIRLTPSGDPLEASRA